MKLKRFALILAVITLPLGLLVGASAAHAGEPGDWNFEVYAGWYFSGEFEEPNELPGNVPGDLEGVDLDTGDDLTWGLRFGRQQSEHWGWQVTTGGFNSTDPVDSISSVTRLSLDLILLDFSALYYIGEGNFYIYGGPGWAFLEVELDPSFEPAYRQDASDFSLHAGLAYNFDVSEVTYIRVDGRLRYIDSDLYEGSGDAEITVAIGFNFGG